MQNVLHRLRNMHWLQPQFQRTQTLASDKRVEVVLQKILMPQPLQK
jgi:hypothetical protein